MMKHGALAVAIVQRQVMVVKAVRSHASRERLLDVCAFTPIGDRLFMATDVPSARISSSDILTIFPFQSSSPDHSAPPTITPNSSCDTLINEEEARVEGEGREEGQYVHGGRLSASAAPRRFRRQYGVGSQGRGPRRSSAASSTSSSITFEMLELPPDAWSEFSELYVRNQKRHEKLWEGSGIAIGSMKVKNKTLRFW